MRVPSRNSVNSCMRTVTLLFFLLLFSGGLKSQSCNTYRYYDRLFSVQATTDLVFGTAPALIIPFVAENATFNQDLKLDLYEPAGDTLAKRPLLLFAFGGGFVVGSKEDADIQAVCDSFASRGFVTAAINYRLGVNVASTSSGERAVWRGAQDYSAAIRYFKEFADSFRIDTNYIFAGGVSAGSFSLLHCQYATDAQRPASTFGSSFPVAPDLGCKDCSGNNYAHSSSVKAAINCWGAIGDTAWFDAQDSVPLISFHGDIDAIVPYGYGFPFTAILTLPRVYGSSLIDIRMRNLGLPHQFVDFPGVGHNIWGTVALNAWAVGSPTVHLRTITHDIRDFLYPFVAPDAPLPFGPSFSAVGATETYIVPPQAGSRFCWTVTGGAVMSNPDSNVVHVQWNLPGFHTLRVREINAIGATSIADSIAVSVLPTGVAEATASDLGVFPSVLAPGDELHLVGKKRMEQVEWLDGFGRVLKKWERTGERIRLNCPNVASGLYFLRVHTQAGVQRVRIQVR